MGLNTANLIYGIPGTSVSASISLIDFSIQRQAEVKEATDVNNQFLAVAKGKEKYVATWSGLLETSGSTAAVPVHNTLMTLTNPSSADMAGNWYVSGTPKIDWKNDDFTKLSGECTKWLTAGGTL